MVTNNIDQGNYYTYLVGWTALNKWYYGVRYSKRANPKDLWVKYFTSSKRVKYLRTEFGEPDVIQVRRTFTTKEKAIRWEAKVLTRMKVLEDRKWLNANIMNERFIGCRSKNSKVFSREEALAASKKARLVNLGKKRPEHAQFIRENHHKWERNIKTGTKSPSYGKKHSAEVLKLLSDLTKIRPRACCIICHRPSNGSIHEGQWTCHIKNHHRDCTL